MTKMSEAALRDAEWVFGFGSGVEWLDGDGSGFRPNRLAQLKDAKVLIPHLTKPGMLMVGDRP